ncbi:SusC/RagA family TonB-linked outer membrane protein [Sphingobacterium detergens]|uniref:TonB-linked SusC/RagA family outer membrane protein n=1 Tax=Sphingobacterium detergens TaxID=1145106 RepID=A0A420AXU3_SPHD1|nr:TonB-dependent receptor [Sphingobacterium detergens]RKE49257.1 TonB-linked SusC/RagA family outer membrane protein [Sphingobacterium detergens]
MVKKSHLILLTPLTILSVAAPFYVAARPNNPKTAIAQAVPQQSISGKVVDETGKPISGVTVSEKGKTAATTTGQDGRFTLAVTSQNATLVFNSIGFIAQELPASQVAEVTLKKSEDMLEEVVVVGYGKQKKSDLTGSVATVEAKSLDRINSPNIVDKLQGKVSGLAINSGNAKPGETAAINIRGENSISASNSPLIILDGIPFSGSLGDISSNTIASISVLKDASSTAIYGSRAANGVILITSKKGAAGKARINYNGYFGLQSVERRLKLMNGPQYIQFMRDYQASKGKTGDQLNPENYLFANVLEQYKKGEEVNWQNEAFNSAAPIHEHQLSFSGGTDKSDYYASVSYLNQDGVVKNTPYERYNVNLNLNQSLNSWLKLGMTMQASQGNRDGIQPNLESVVKLAPYSKNRDENGTAVTYPMYAQTLWGHPFADENGQWDETRRTVFANSWLDVKLPIEGLSFKSTFGTNYRNINENSYYGSNTLTGRGVNGRGEIKNDHFWDWTWENLLTYDRTFGDHKINVVGLYSSQKTNLKTSKMTGDDFVSDAGYNNMASASKNLKMESKLENTAMISYMGRINYSFKDRYLLTLTGRSDGYSAFSVDNRYAFFPSVAGAWVISKEGNVQDYFDLLKLRASYGKNGNQAVSPYQTYDRLTNVDYIYGLDPVKGLVMNFNGRGSNLTWETTSSLNVGLDFGILKNRLSGTIDYYTSKTTDLLLSEQVPVMNGYNTILNNIGETSNKGFEVTLNAVPIKNDNFQWNTTANFAYNNNKITKLRADGKDDLTNAWLIGKPIRIFYDYKVIGVWQEGDDIANSYQPKAKAGDAKLADLNNDGKIDANDRTVMGNKISPYTLGIGNDFTYKNFSLSIFMNGAFGGTKVDDFKNIERFLPNNGANYLTDMPYWTPQNPSTDIPSPGYTPVNNHTYYINSAYWRIRDLSLGYTFEGDFLKRLNLSSVRAFINARNIYTFSKIKGYNVEALGVSSTTGNPTTTNIAYPYPVARTVSLGLNVQF